VLAFGEQIPGSLETLPSGARLPDQGMERKRVLCAPEGHSRGVHLKDIELGPDLFDSSRLPELFQRSLEPRLPLQVLLEVW
jgi:hypothetical protein